MIAKGVTSEPVPDVVGIATIVAFLPSSGILQILFLISKNLIATSSNTVSGCSYNNHIILAASIGEPPPNEMITSGSNGFIISIACLIVDNVGSGFTSKNTSWSIPISSNTLIMLSTAPELNKNLSVTMNARFLPSSSRRAKSTAPLLK